MIAGVWRENLFLDTWEAELLNDQRYSSDLLLLLLIYLWLIRLLMLDGFCDQISNIFF